MPTFRWPPDLPGEGSWASPAAMGIFRSGGSRESAAPPPPAPPQPIPDIEDPALLARKRKEAEAAMSRSGRLSTMLTDDEGYSGRKLGLR
jgi:hypothetical protein